jgi:hypothetical protein
LPRLRPKTADCSSCAGSGGAPQGDPSRPGARQCGGGKYFLAPAIRGDPTRGRSPCLRCCRGHCAGATLGGWSSSSPGGSAGRRSRLGSACGPSWRSCRRPTSRAGRAEAGRAGRRQPRWCCDRLRLCPGRIHTCPFTRRVPAAACDLATRRGGGIKARLRTDRLAPRWWNRFFAEPSAFGTGGGAPAFGRCGTDPC